MADITASNVKNITGANETTGRNHDVWGAREVGLYRVTLTNSAPAGGFTFDPKTFGFQGEVAGVWFSKKVLVANIPSMGRYSFQYDYVNKKIVPIDATDANDDATGDDLSNIILDVYVISI
jgi:hypothetical protein